jgi:hypothetical protein
MKLIIVYGPPAVGKLTTANALSELTGFGVVHNHLTGDLACALFDKTTVKYRQFSDHLRYEIFTTAVEEDVPGLIFTYAYRPAISDEFLNRVLSIVESGGGKVYFVRLKCSSEKQVERVVCETRKSFTKIITIEELEKKSAEFPDQPIPRVDSLLIDNSDIVPSEAARMIVEHYGLPWRNNGVTHAH